MNEGGLGKMIGELIACDSLISASMLSCLVGLGVIAREDAVQILRQTAEWLERAESPPDGPGFVLVTVVEHLRYIAKDMEGSASPRPRLSIVQGGRKD